MPRLIYYQGKVVVNGVNFKGTGEFKFALVNADGTVTHWSNDGTSTAGREPAAAVTISVVKGCYSVFLGDAALADILALPAGPLAEAEVFLRVWFNDGKNGSQLLKPDQRVAMGMGEILLAGETPQPRTPAGIGVTSPDPAPRAFDDNLPHSRTDQMRSGGTTEGDTWQQRGGLNPPARERHGAVWTGSEMIIWRGEGVESDGRRYNPAGNYWTPVSTSAAPATRYNNTMVWTGKEMIVWGGRAPRSGFYLANGGRYDPASDSWTPVNSTGQPGARDQHTAVWTGSEMIVWGGLGDAGWLRDGGRYNPLEDSWKPLSPVAAPLPRVFHVAVWTGEEMIVWGGSTNSLPYITNTGSRYSPETDTWKSVTLAGAPSPRSAPGVWTGTEMVVWGGAGNTFVNTGGRYDPTSNSWRPVNLTGAPTARSGHTATWTGTEVVVWGGSFVDFDPVVGPARYLDDGARYNPTDDSWDPIATTEAPAPRSSHTAVWTGSEVMVWGGAGLPTGIMFDDGGRYSPATDAWIPLRSSNAPSARSGHTAVWTGEEMLVWGGSYTFSTPFGQELFYFNDGKRYDAATAAWTALSDSGAPSGRSGHTALWTGTEMIVWVGVDGLLRNDGGRYDPVANNWTPLSAIGAPTRRLGYSAVWTGKEMVVWGGAENNLLNDGARYNPLNNSWAPVNTTGAPAPRFAHSAVWADGEMVVWGGHTNTNNPNVGGRYDPSKDSWMPVTATGAPATPRMYHTAVWTGREMVIWGGSNPGNPFNSYGDGGRYSPVNDSWSAVSRASAPAPRFEHSAVWTGTEMIIWGGTGGNDQDFFWYNFGNGGRYDPAANLWRPMTLIGAPAARARHTAVWTGNEMIVYGGEMRHPFALGSGPTFFGDTFSYSPPRASVSPGIGGLARDGSDLTISFPTVANCIYTLWRSDSLADGSWINTGLPPIVGTGSLRSFAVSISDASGFFRVQLGP